MLSIGEFSKLSNVSANTLRFYDEIGLLKPVFVNQESGYRYYEAEQLKTVLLINRLKLYSFSLEEVGELINEAGNNEKLIYALYNKKTFLQGKKHELNLALRQLEEDLLNLERGRKIMAYLDKIEVRLVQREPETILYIREYMSTEDYGKMIGRLYERITADKLTVTGMPMTVFHHGTEFNPEHYDNEVAIPVKEAVEGTRTLPGGLCVTAKLVGPYSNLPSVYAKLKEFVESEGYEADNEPFEFYLTDPFNNTPDKLETEVYFPVKKK